MCVCHLDAFLAVRIIFGNLIARVSLSHTLNTKTDEHLGTLRSNLSEIKTDQQPLRSGLEVRGGGVT